MIQITKHSPADWRKALSKPDAPRPLDLRRIARQIHHFGSFVLRMPALPYFGTSERCLLRVGCFGEKMDAKDAFRLERSRIADLCADPIICEAIYVASPSLYEKLVVAQDAQNELPLDVVFSALRYITRMSSRGTPFGLFAGVATGIVGADSLLWHPKAEAIVPHIRLDMSVIDEIVSQVSQCNSVRKAIPLRVNDTYCELNECSARYVESHTSEGGAAYSLANIEPTPHITACITYARENVNKTASELAQFITNFDNEISHDDALEFIYGLIDEQLLIPAVAPAITSCDALGDLIGLPGVAEELPALHEVHRMIHSSDRQLAGSRALINQIDSALSSLPFKVKEGRTVHVDAHYPNTNSALSEEVIRTIIDALYPYYAMSYRTHSGPLEHFKSEFVKRFGTKEVPLAMALDGECGIRFDVNASSSDSLRITDAILLNRIVESSKLKSGNGVGEIALTDDDIIAISAGVPNDLPKTMSIMGSLSKVEGIFDIRIKGVSAPCGAQLLGRFAFASPPIEQLVHDMIAFEEASDPTRIFAEIVHVPAGRIGNVISRPAFRMYEIPCASTVSEGRRSSFPLSDLLLSVNQDRIVLRSASLGLEVLPRLSCAHNFSGNNLNIYQFLCSLQYQDGGSFSFTWGHPFNLLNYIPRLRYRNCIFALARWRILPEFVEGLKAVSRRGPEIALEWLQIERRRSGMPRIIQVEESDNALVFDLENSFSVALFADFLDIKRHAYLVEGPLPEHCAVKDADGNGYTSEFVLPLYIESQPQGGVARHTEVVSVNEQSSDFEDVVAMGGKVAYLKVYGGENSIDNFIKRDLRRIWSELASDEPGLRMFYVRYFDSAHHLRIRFLLKDADRLWSTIVPQLLKELTACNEKHLLRDTQADTYEREVSRYGGQRRMTICETIFSYDTMLTLDALELLDATHINIQRWRYAVFVAHFIVESVFASLSERLQLFNELFVAFANRGGAPREMLKANFANMDRMHRKTVDSILYQTLEASSFESDLLDRNKETLSAYRNALRSLELNFDNVVDRGIMVSIVHMSMNRIFAINANREEAVIYYLVTRSLESHLARHRQKEG